MAARPQSGGGEGLSPRTLLIAAIASGGAAVIVSYFWETGTVMAAAITPVIVSLLREAVLPKAIDRPARALAEVRTTRRTTDFPAVAGAGLARSRAPGAGVTTAETPPATERLPAEEPGLEDLDRETARLEEAAPADGETEGLDPATRRLEEQTRPVEGETEPLAGPPPPVAQALPPRSEPTERAYGSGDLDRNGGPVSSGPPRSPSSAPRRVYGGSRRVRVRLAVITGLLGFLIAAVVLTVPELVAGGSLGGGDGRTTLFSAGDGESQQGDGAEDRVTDGVEGESPDGDGGEEGGDTEPAPDGGDGSSEPGEPNSERPQENQRSTERRAEADQQQGGESGASQRSSSQRAPAPRAAPKSPSSGGGSAP